MCTTLVESERQAKVVDKKQHPTTMVPYISTRAPEAVYMGATLLQCDVFIIPERPRADRRPLPLEQPRGDLFELGVPFKVCGVSGEAGRPTSVYVFDGVTELKHVLARFPLFWRERAVTPSLSPPQHFV